MSIKRRVLLKGSFVTGVLATTFGVGLFKPRQALAAWPEAAFEKNSLAGAISAITHGAKTTVSENIHIKTPSVVENGSLVPVTIVTDIPNVKKISLFVEKNSPVLAASFDLAAPCDGFVSTRIRMKKTANIVAVVQANGEFYQAKTRVKIKTSRC